MSNLDNVKILRVTTVSISLAYLLKGQLEYMSKRGLDVYMACAEDDQVQEIAQVQKAKYLAIPLTRTISPFKDLKALWKAIKLIKQLKPSIVHTHTPKAGLIGMMAAWYCKVPLRIHTVAGLPLMEEKGLKLQILKFVEKLTYYCANYVLPNSNELKKYIISSGLHKGSDKIQVIGKGSSNGIDLTYFNKSASIIAAGEQFRQKHNIPAAAKVITFVGRLVHYKGIVELVAAFKRLSHSNVYLVLVGGDEQELNPLPDEIWNEIKSNEKIIAVGNQKDIRPFLAASNLFAFPSYREGFPQSLMQACAMQLPCIASNINGCNEIIEDGTSGRLIPVKNTDALYDALVEFMQHPEKYEQFAQNGYHNIKDNYEQQHLWNLIYQFYSQNLPKRN